jgi:hypothetical protein
MWSKSMPLPSTFVPFGNLRHCVTRVVFVAFSLRPSCINVSLIGHTSDVTASVAGITQLFQDWKKLPYGSDEFIWTENELKTGVNTIEWDLQDLEETINILALDATRHLSAFNRPIRWMCGSHSQCSAATARHVSTP